MSNVCSPVPVMINDETMSASYTRLAGTFLYQGTDNTSALNMICASAFRTSGTSMDIRIRNITDPGSPVVIAEKMGITDTDPAIVDLGIITNLPKTASVLEVQARQVGGGIARVDSIDIFAM